MKNHTRIPDKEKHQEIEGVNIETLELTNNYVLCKRVTNNVEDGINGIVYPKQYHQNEKLPQNVDRVFKVIRIPNEITPERTFWMTNIEVKPGDTVWVNYIDALNSPNVYDEDGVEYRLLSYFSLIVAKRKKAVIPLNGRVIMSNIYASKLESKWIHLSMKSKIEYALAKVEYVGTPNKYYFDVDDSDEGIDIKRGDVVILDLINKNTASMSRKYIEDELYSKFNDKKMYFYEQRRDIYGILVDKV